MTETPSAQEKFLTDFHNQNTGVTARAYAPLPATMGQRVYPSTYECLVNVVPTGDEATTVLDLACGDGWLLSLLAKREQAAHALIGIDMSQQGILGALSPRFGSVVIDEITLRRRYAPAELWAWFEGLYDLHFMPLAQRLELRDAYLVDLKTLVEDDGKLEFTNTLRQVTAVVTKNTSPCSLE
ncbi:MAG: hypothetical protein GZ093_00520 [Rhodoferax sp.]|uniref:class I SAM-dependent methyltransferase n=1 Tax=Rhodoferax sp. TaxID=50421 RepID=UPI0013FF086A|nr:class I SAM-dependent methyltransferase [Rhodoferax sp.]NDP37228.1 hypothetical protein [Rhodoferax sp.]